MNNDKVNPAHYKSQCSIECIDAILAVLGIEGTINFCLGNCVKYCWRFKNKNGEEDLAKADWYISKSEDLLVSLDFKDGRVASRVDAVRAMFQTIVGKNDTWNICQEIPHE